jgi:hypothetical protein
MTWQTMVVEVVPPRSTVVLLLIWVASSFANVSYSVNDESDRHPLVDTPHILLGWPIKLENPVPERLLFSNDADDDADVAIVLARDVTP